MKKFFDDIKKDIKFKSAGPGKKLTEEASGGTGGQRKGRNSRGTMTRDLFPFESQMTSLTQHLAHGDQYLLFNSFFQGSKVPVKDPACLSVSGVYFTCPLTGATLTKSEREVHIKEAILMRFEEDAVEASVMMVHTFNKDREKVKAAVEIISKYIENICKNPTEEKYRKIKLSNKVYQEKVRCVEGSREFLEALSFTSIMLPVEGQEEDEEFLVLLEHSPDGLELMKESRDRLHRGEPVRAQLDRQPQAFRSSPNAQRFELPVEFYNLTAEELKKEQQQRSELVDKNAMLRTKVMREKEEQRERRKYNYTLLRIRLPDGSLLQGTFYAWDRLPVLFAFVRESLVDGWQPFELIAPGSQKLKETEEVALAECNLVPAALLTFAWDAAVQADVAAAGATNPALLKPELLETIRTLS
uniref:UBX domain-containing protein 6 n=1 Tax=Cyclopterus lumpus TaxID=8103 RepID=A0A8C2X7F5_CYCLU